MQPEVRVRKFHPLREHRGPEKLDKRAHDISRTFKHQVMSAPPPAGSGWAWSDLGWGVTNKTYDLARLRRG